MAKVQRIAVARKQGQRRIELPDQVEVSLAGLAGRAKQELLAFAVSVGLEVFATMLEEDRTRICGPRGRHDPSGRTASRHGSEPSRVVLGGRQVPFDRPRARTLAGEEVTLPT